jgi:hypothetical protein
LTVCATWTGHGRSDGVAATMLGELGHSVRTQPELARAGELPQWLGQEQFHLSHQSSLLRKDPAHYRPIFGTDVPDDLPYVWPASDRWLRP